MDKEARVEWESNESDISIHRTTTALCMWETVVKLCLSGGSLAVGPGSIHGE